MLKVSSPNIMHELTITQSILSIVLDQAETARANKITRIDLTIGELAGVVDECVEFYFDIIGKDTIAAGAELVFKRPLTSLRCRNCDVTFTPDNMNLVCPECREQNVEIVSGRECYIESIEVQ